MSEGHAADATPFRLADENNTWIGRFATDEGDMQLRPARARGERWAWNVRALLAVSLILSACESDEKKVERLQAEGIAIRQDVELYHVLNASGAEGSLDSLRASERRLILHERDLQRFMSTP